MTPSEVNAAYLAGEHVPSIAEHFGITPERVMGLVAQDRAERATDGVLPGMEAA